MAASFTGARLTTKEGMLKKYSPRATTMMSVNHQNNQHAYGNQYACKI
jgi:hypothetical protein